MKRWFILLCIVFVVGAFGCKRGESEKEVVAVVNDEEITKAALLGALLERYGGMALSELIMENLVQQEAAKEGVRLTPKERDDAFVGEVSMVGGLENFERRLRVRGISEGAFKKGLFMQVLLRKLAGKDLVVTDEEMEVAFVRLYGERRTLQQISVRKTAPGETAAEETLVPASPAPPREVGAREGEREEVIEAEESSAEWEQEPKGEAQPVAVETKRDPKARAEEIHKELEAGADFTRIAVRRTEPLEARTRGGIIFEVPRGIFPAELEEALFSLEVGEISPVLESREAYHIFRVLSITPAQEVKLRDKKKELQDLIKREKIEAVAQELVRSLQEDGKIERHFSP